MRSSAFEYGDEIPAEYTRPGGFAPPLSWTGAPTGTSEYALIFEDADSPRLQERQVYWLLYRIPVSSTDLPHARRSAEAPTSVPGSMHGRNSTGTLGYAGPYPPADGEWHHYRFRLLALSHSSPDLRPGMTLSELSSAIQGKVLETTDLIGRARRPHKAVSAA